MTPHLDDEGEAYQAAAEHDAALQDALLLELAGLAKHDRAVVDELLERELESFRLTESGDLVDDASNLVTALSMSRRLEEVMNG